MRVVVMMGILALFCGLVSGQEQKAPGSRSFVGHYELAAAKSDQSISLDITQTATNLTVSFSAAMVDGSGAAPDGDGTGKVDKAGSLKFIFTDSFGNECSGTLIHEKNEYRFTVNPIKVVDPRPLRFYGDNLLQKTSAKPSQ